MDTEPSVSASPFVVRARRHLRRVAHFASSALRDAFGEVCWTPPPWTARVATAERDAERFLTSHRRETRLVLLGTLAFVLLVWVGWRWYESRARSRELSVAVTAPERTCYECV